MIYSSLKIDLQPTPKEEFIIGLEVTGLQFTREQDIFVAFLLEAKLLIHQLINYGMNLRICSSILNSVPSKFTSSQSNP